MRERLRRAGRGTLSEPARWQRGAVARFLVMAVCVFVLPMVVTLELKHLVERGFQAERDLQAVVTELQVQDGLEWRAIIGRERPQDVVQALTASRERATKLIKRAHRGGLGAGATQQLGELSRDYARAVDEEVRLLATGAQTEAAELDETRVDPAFEHFSNALADHGLRVSARAARARDISDGAMLITLLLSLGLTTVVQSRRKRVEVTLEAERRTEARYRSLIDQSADLVLVTDRDGRTRFLSPSAERLLITGDPSRPASKDARQVDLLAAVEGSDRAALSGALRDAAPGHSAAVEVGITTREGSRIFDVSVQDLTGDPSVGGLVLTAHDVTDRLALHREMEHRSRHDNLTGLPNRALLADRFDQALRAAHRDGTAAGLLLIDLDRFKEINDTFGHQYGDALLTQVGHRLAGALRDTDTVARLGGDEFAVLLPDVHDVAEVAAVAAKLQLALEAPFQVEGVDLDVEASIGVVVSGEHGSDATTLLQHADIAMYVAKTRSLGVFAYDPAVDGHSPAKLALLGDLRRALERGELLLHYQPKVSLSSGEVVGAEALVRWQHPGRGMVMPDDFIPLAEHTGLIGPLTRYVLNAALAQVRIWADAGQPLKVSVNLSARNLLDERLPDLVARLLDAHGVPPDLLELEVTESALMIEPVRAQQLLRRLSDIGVRISIDDFGAGYTSLGQLKTLPIAELKIDKSFVLTMTENRNYAMIVHSVIELGHNLGLSIVAEGVETEEALSALWAFGCDVAQGFHLCRPIDVEAFDAWRAGQAALATAGTATAAATASSALPDRPHLAAIPFS